MYALGLKYAPAGLVLVEEVTVLLFLLLPKTATTLMLQNALEGI